MPRVRGTVLALTLLLAGARIGHGETLPREPRQSPPDFVGKAWVSTDPSAAPGTMKVFLADGTLLMDSCGESYRLARWRAIDRRRVEWQEDTATIRAEVGQPSPDRLQLRLRLAKETKIEAYRLAKAPFVCPDTRPSVR